MIVCPNCGKVLSYNSYFGGYICTNCEWEDISEGTKRNQGVSYVKVSCIRCSKNRKKRFSSQGKLQIKKAF